MKIFHMDHVTIRGIQFINLLNLASLALFQLLSAQSTYSTGLQGTDCHFNGALQNHRRDCPEDNVRSLCVIEHQYGESLKRGGQPRGLLEPS